jgi:4-cresol dehydrogenase (hydroxylating)
MDILKRTEKILEKISLFLNESQIIKGEDTKSKPYHYSCILVDKNILGILKPKTTLEIQKIVKLANSHKIPIYPISTGKNWGYGTANPVKTNSIILDLSLMNKIIEFDNTLGFVRIEPGVTQQQLYEYLEKNNSKFQMDPTGSAPSTSVLANALERGFGIGQYNNHFDSLSNLEIVLPKGELVNTGFGHYSNSKSANVYKYGIGPYIDGLFSQSNLGIVTVGTMYLAPKAESIEMMAIKFEDKNKLSAIIDSLQKLRINNICNSSINVFSRNRVLTTKTRFPFDMTNDSMMSKSISKQLGIKHGLSSWTILTGLSGSKEQVSFAKKLIRKELKKFDEKINFISEKKLEFMMKNKWLIGPFIKHFQNLDIEQLYGSLKKALLIFKGMPSTASMQSPYFRSKRKYNDYNPNPAQDNCGLYWISPVVPFTGNDVIKVFQIGEKICTKYHFDFAPTYSLASSRFIDNTIPLMYNKDDKEETLRAQKCNQELINEFKKAGYIIYRAGITSMDLVVDKDDTFWKLKKDIKNQLDPNNIIAPGRYE